MLKCEPEFLDEDVEISESCKDIIRKLLQRDPEQRLGRRGAAEIKAHPFFSGIDWTSLYRNKAVFVPALQSEVDTTYFHERPVRPLPSLQCCYTSYCFCCFLCACAIKHG